MLLVNLSLTIFFASLGNVFSKLAICSCCGDRENFSVSLRARKSENYFYRNNLKSDNYVGSQEPSEKGNTKNKQRETTFATANWKSDNYMSVKIFVQVITICQLKFLFKQ